MPKVFVSYSHDSDEHRQSILAFSDQLREDGIDCWIDQYINGAPAGGCQRWMEKHVKNADFVLLVCTSDLPLDLLARLRQMVPKMAKMLSRERVGRGRAMWLRTRA
jgi:hypothetical protein